MSPLEWLGQLEPKLKAQSDAAAYYLRYYDGDQPISSITTTKYREAFSKLIASVCDNWLPLVVDAVEERMHVDGFRMTDEPKADTDATEIWQRSFLDADSQLEHSVVLTTGIGSLMVWPNAAGEPIITVEHPQQVYLATASGNRRMVLAGLKMWCDEWTGAEFANVYLPEAIYKFKRTKDESSSTKDEPAWVVRDETVPNTIGVVPLVPMLNRPTMFGIGRSEISEVISTQDQINKLVADMLIASEFSAFKQRWATGIEIPTDPTTGKEREDFIAAADRLWHVPAPDSKFGEFGQTDLAIYVKAIENRIQSLASRTRTPPHYLLGTAGTFPSGESLRATETGLVAKVKSRMRVLGEAWESSMRLAFKFKSDPRAEAWSAETIWRDPEYRTEAEHVDALGKLRTMLQVPLQQLWQDAGYTPAQIGRFQTMLLDEALNRLLLEPTAPAPGPQPTPPQTVPVNGQ